MFHVGPELHPVVSFDDEPLILVDESDAIVGYDTKAACHRGTGMLHRAFSVFLFDAAGRLLLQQRSAHKPLWPLYWANTCCSHPRRGESIDAAAQRRTAEELAVRVPLRFAYKFTYRAQFGAAGSEYELCSVYAGHLPAQEAVRVNPREVAATRLVDASEVDRLVDDPAAAMTPWLRLEWPRLRRDHAALLQAVREPPRPR